ncbi:spermatogenesis associated 6-like protein isoform X1 [Ambystoma mexicanum]|uniref:spermatogenesis associated 6-like protein isoform X1 n=1 Tax=Ambystoma mexicanum TaxID=8296 RepID=UPI0037E7FC66
MPLKVQVELHIQAITCPGVFLQEKDDIYLSVSMLGQWKETECLPPVFPLLFHEKMKFEKIFQEAIDPATVVQLLECDMVKFELTQLTPPMGEFLAFYEENTREFLFPEPKLTPSYRGVDREVLMKTVRNFPGIAPKLEFATRTSIKELSTDVRRRSYEESKVSCRRTQSASPSKKGSSPANSKLKETNENHFEKAPPSSRSRSPPTYQQRCMCLRCTGYLKALPQLSQSSLVLKADTEGITPYVVRHEEKNEHCRRTSPVSVRKTSFSPAKRSKAKTRGDHFEKTSKPSRSRSPSPFTRRIMHELNKKRQQRLNHSSEGAYEMNSDRDARPSLVVSDEENKVCCRRSPSASRGRRRRSPEKSITCLRKDKHFEKATKASKSRSPSPYTRRRMCQLNKDNQQRLSQLSLGNYEFKSDIDARPPFVVRHVDKSKPVGAKTSSQLRSQSSRQPSRCNCVEAPIKRALSFDSYENSKGSEKVPMDPGELSMSEYDESSFLDSCEFLNFPDKSTPGSPEFQYTSSPSDLLRQKPLSPILRRSPLRQRLQSDQSNTWESIHDRVRSLLTSNSAKQRLLCGATNSEIEDVLKRRSISLRNTPNIG